MSRRLWLQIAVLAVVLLAVSESKKAKKKAAVLSSAKLAPYVMCDTCIELGKALYAQANEIKKEKGGRKKMGEEPILELLESICEPGTKEGEWINAMDVVGVKGRLRIEKRDEGFQECRTQECLAIARACDDVRSEAGESEIAEKIYQGHYTTSADDFSKALCNKMSGICQDVPELSSKRLDEEFALVDHSTWESKKMEKMMKSMGMGGKMYDRNSMNEMMEGMDEDYMNSMGGGGMGMDDDMYGGEDYEDFAEPPPIQDSGPKVEDVSFSNFVKDTASVLQSGAEYATNTVVEGIRQAVETVSGKPRGEETEKDL